MPRWASHNLHVPLPADTYQELKNESDRVHQPATTLAREAIRYWLEERRRSRLAQEIQEYARAHAGTAADLDADLERVAIEQLVKPASRRRTR